MDFKLRRIRNGIQKDLKHCCRSLKGNRRDKYFQNFVFRLPLMAYNVRISILITANIRKSMKCVQILYDKFILPTLCGLDTVEDDINNRILKHK